MRLQGPQSENGTGRIEVFFRGQWGAICYNNWDLRDANVACRQLGYRFAVRTLPWYQVPDGSERTWLAGMYCTGNERSLADCSHSGWRNHYCGYYGEAGVECSSSGMVND